MIRKVPRQSSSFPKSIGWRLMELHLASFSAKVSKWPQETGLSLAEAKPNSAIRRAIQIIRSYRNILNAALKSTRLSDLEWLGAVCIQTCLANSARLCPLLQRCENAPIVVTKTRPSRARLSGSDASHRICYSAAFITTIAESSFRYTQGAKADKSN